MAGAADVAEGDVAAAVVLVAAGCWKHCCGAACSVISQVAVAVGDRAAAGAVAEVSGAAVSAAEAVVVLAADLVAETVLAAAARVGVGKSGQWSVAKTIPVTHNGRPDL